MSLLTNSDTRVNALPNGTVLSVKNLTTHFFLRNGEFHAVDNVSFEVKHGETLAIVGESGAGKSQMIFSMLRLLKSPPGKVLTGEVILDGRDVMQMKKSELRRVRGKRIALILQEPMSSLNPSKTIGRQIQEAVELHQGMKGDAAKEKTLEMLKLVRIPVPEKRYYNYPHELSGGMKQRIMIATALACRPEVLIADEPTCSLDVTIQAQVMDLLKKLIKEINTTLILVSHDLGIVAEMADRVAIMYAGEIVEIADVFDLFEKPLHPYTAGIVGTMADMKKGGEVLQTIPGEPPNLLFPPSGCRFHPRCPYVEEICMEVTPPDLKEHERLVKCHFPLKY